MTKLEDPVPIAEARYPLETIYSFGPCSSPHRCHGELQCCVVFSLRCWAGQVPSAILSPHLFFKSAGCAGTELATNRLNRITVKCVVTFDQRVLNRCPLVKKFSPLFPRTDGSVFA